VTDRRYTDPAALRRAVTDRLRMLAGREYAQLADLQRQFAYDRLLARIFLSEPDDWVLKGATALLARLRGRARHTIDVDLYRPVAGLDEAEAALRRAAASDLGDFFRFVLAPGRRVAEGRATLRVPVTAYLGATEFARFHVDLVTDIAMTGQPEDSPPLVPLDLPGIPAPTYRLYPIADHIADKVCALLEVHPRAAGVAQPSTRYRDLADLVVIAHTQRFGAEPLARALGSESRRRGIGLPEAFPGPIAPVWRAGYARVARDVPSLAEQDLGSALAAVQRLIDPVLAGRASGDWDPDRRLWTDDTRRTGDVGRPEAAGRGR
jgi:hypothetical protein